MIPHTRDDYRFVSQTLDEIVNRKRVVDFELVLGITRVHKQRDRFSR